jgi:hypothetical protein
MLPMLSMQPPNTGYFDEINPMADNGHVGMIGEESGEEYILATDKKSDAHR